MSSFDYREQSRRITRVLAERYGNHSAVVGWQLDNEFGCHDTVRSYDKDAANRFRTWLKNKYGTIETLNERQGRVFWSTQYASFDAVQPPFLEVYTLNEAHTLDWYTFSSDMVIEFAREQTNILRELSPDKVITTNMMVLFTDFDHHAFARETGIDIATFDQYPLAGVSAASPTDQEMADYLRTGAPDLQALNHALYRGVSGAAYNKTSGPFGVMEQQPGVLNWNPYRVSPAEGMVRLWTHETFAASGDMVNYFRWRQVPFAQEQTLSGLFTEDNMPDEGFSELQAFTSNDLPILRSQNLSSIAQADVALVFDYTANWVWAIEPYSGTWSVKDAGYTDPTLTYTTLFYNFYAAARRLGLSIDIISPEQDISGYKMLIVPSLPIIPATFSGALANFSGPVIFGPYTGARTPDFAYPPGLPPSAGTLRDRLPMRVTRVETPPTYANSGVSYAERNYSISAWEENLTCTRQNSTSNVTAAFTSRHQRDKPAACSKNGVHYLGFNPPVDMLVSYIADVAGGAGIRDLAGRKVVKENDLGATMRLARRGGLLWTINYSLDAQAAPEIQGELIIGEEGDLPGAGVKVWKLN